VSGWELLSQCLSAAGVRRIFGRPIPGLAHVPAPHRPLAALLADADGRLGPGPGAAWFGGVLRLSSKPGASGKRRAVTSLSDLPEAVVWAASVAGGALPGCAELSIEADLDAPAAGRPAKPPRSGWSGMILGSQLGRVLVFAGPGVVRAGAGEGLRGLTEAVGLGVSTSWGAAGVLGGDSPHHLGTVGLQARDFELGGFHDADTIVATGIDPDEAPAARWTHGRVVTIPPAMLIGLVTQWASRVNSVVSGRPPLLDLIDHVLELQRKDDNVPLAPGRVLSDLAAAMAPGELLAADPGPAGLWVAAAAALAGALRQPRLRVTGVTSGPLDDASKQVLDLARSLDATLVLEVWGDGGDLDWPAQHVVALNAARTRRGVNLVDVPVDFGWTDALVDGAGPVVAWT
jgi:Thiamine pyrophosphate enzyme, central domain